MQAVAKRVTISDVARACGVDKATVSRALRGLASVKPETAARVREKAEELVGLVDRLVKSGDKGIPTHPLRLEIPPVWSGPDAGRRAFHPRGRGGRRGVGKAVAAGAGDSA